MDRRSLILGMPLLAVAGPVLAQPLCSGGGGFSGSPQIELLPSGRGVRLLKDLTFTDPCGERWTAREGMISDGASIPRILWTLVGAPFSSAYRDAAIVHDWYCAVRVKPASEVHRMFYHAMLARNLGDTQARLLYAGVRMGGPSWDDLTIANNILATGGGRYRRPVPYPPPAPSPVMVPRPEVLQLEEAKLITGALEPGISAADRALREAEANSLSAKSLAEAARYDAKMAAFKQQMALQRAEAAVKRAEQEARDAQSETELARAILALSNEPELQRLSLDELEARSPIPKPSDSGL